MHECPKTHFKHKCMHASHHATSSCYVTMPHHHDTLSCHVIRMHFLTTTWHFSQNFPCWGQTSKCNIFCIRSPFDTPFAPLESAWWALRHGTIFVALWWFWKLAFLDPPESFFPTGKAFGPQKLLAGMLIYFLLHWFLHKLLPILGFLHTANFCS